MGPQSAFRNRDTRVDQPASIAVGTRMGHLPAASHPRRSDILTLVGPATSRRARFRDRWIVHASMLLLCRLVRPAGHRRRNPRTRCNGVSTLRTCPPGWPSRRAAFRQSRALSEPVIAASITRFSAQNVYAWRPKATVTGFPEGWPTGHRTRPGSGLLNLG